MATSIIDGTIEEVEVKRRRKLGTVFKRILFRLDDGTTKTWAKAVVWNNVADQLKPGFRGRFYLYTAMDHRGLHGFRTADGREAYGFGKQNEIISLVIFVMMALLVAISFSAMGDAPLFAVILLVLSVPMYILYRGTRVQAEKQFQGDAGYRPPATA
jgi:hypothetical protein